MNINNTKSVSTNITVGMSINMEEDSIKKFLTNLSVSVISQCRSITAYRCISKHGIGLKIISNIPYYDSLINTYCDDDLSDTILSMIRQNVSIIYEFVQDCVENGINNKLDFLYEKSKYGKPFWCLILEALDEYDTFCLTLAEKSGDSTYVSYYNQYNDKFKKMMILR